MRPTLPVIALALGALGAPAGVLGQAPASVLIPAPEVHLLTAGDGTEHQLFVGLPAAYAEDPDGRFPVLYVLDANTKFAIVAQAQGYREVFGETGPTIVVGVGYPVEDWDEVLVRRTLDYTPTRHPGTEAEVGAWLGRGDVRTGGAEAFLSFLDRSVIPFVDRTYRTDGTRALVGYSWGGLVAVLSLFTAPETFSHYLIASPSLAWDDGAMFALEEAFRERSRSLSASVFLSAGSLEPPTAEGVERLAGVLAERDYQGLDFTVEVWEGETHLSALLPAVNRGLRALFPGPAP